MHVLRDIFKTFWFACRSISDGDYVSKEAYIRIFTGYIYD